MSERAFRGPRVVVQASTFTALRKAAEGEAADFAELHRQLRDDVESADDASPFARVAISRSDLMEVENALDDLADASAALRTERMKLATVSAEDARAAAAERGMAVWLKVTFAAIAGAGLVFALPVAAPVVAVAMSVPLIPAGVLVAHLCKGLAAEGRARAFPALGELRSIVETQEQGVEALVAELAVVVGHVEREAIEVSPGASLGALLDTQNPTPTAVRDIGVTRAPSSRDL